MKTRRLFVPLLMMLAGLGGALPAAAQTTLISNLGNSHSGYFSLNSPSFWIAQAFRTDAQAHTLHSVDTAMAFAGGALPSQVSATLYAAGGDGRIASALTSLGTASGLGGELYRFGGGNFNLAASTTYWIVFAQTTGENPAQLSWTISESTTGPGAFPGGSEPIEAFSNNSGGVWNYGLRPSAPVRFQVNVDGETPAAVPEPGALALFLPGLGVMVVMRRKRP